MLLVLATVAYLLVGLSLALVVGRCIALGQPSDDELARAGPHAGGTPAARGPHARRELAA